MTQYIVNLERFSAHAHFNLNTTDSKSSTRKRMKIVIKKKLKADIISFLVFDYWFLLLC